MKATAIIPCLSYQDAPEAIEWLCKAFGFEKQLVVPEENGSIAHAQLTLGKGVMIMLGSADRQSEFSQYMTHPSRANGRETQTPYIVMHDHMLGEHYERAKAAGAKILVELRAEAYGGRNYSCADPEGHLWNFGSYDPFAEE